MKLRQKQETLTENRSLPPMLVTVLNQLEEGSVVLAPGDVIVFESSHLAKLGIIRDGRVQSPELLASVRVVRRTNAKQFGKIEVARGPIGEGIHELTVEIIPLTLDDLVLVFLSDESEAQRVHDVRRDFVANISHELKTPIGALSLLSEAVLGSKDDPSSVVKFATRMQLEAKRLTDLVQEIIQLSRVQDSDPLKVAKELNLADIIKVAIDQSSTSASARNISVKLGTIDDVAIMGDREQLIMALHNLIDNAINYSPENTNVSVTTSIEDEIVVTSIADQGIGIPDSEVERIFERFYRVDPARSRMTGGTGLGLSIVKHVASKHGGDIKVWSSENVGSTFSIRLPIYKRNEEN